MTGARVEDASKEDASRHADFFSPEKRKFDTPRKYAGRMTLCFEKGFPSWLREP
jgi:hypothetical protein